MTTAMTKMPLDRADALASKIDDVLRPACERIAIVGSVRRQVDRVKDIDMLCIPKPWEFGLGRKAYDNAVDELCDQLVADGRLEHGPFNGPRWKTFIIPGAKRYGTMLELRISTPRRWPVELVVHTGPASFSHALVTPRAQGGWLPEGYVWAGGDWELLDPNGDVVEFREERHVLEVFCGRWIEPEERV